MNHRTQTLLKWLGAILFLSFAVSSCTQENCDYTYTYYEPIYLSYSELRNAPIRNESGRPLQNVGKIYYKDSYIFINERGKGVHIINNRNPENPVEESFIPILGNYDIAIAGTALYADSYTDLVIVDIGDLRNVRLAQRIENAFAHQAFPTSFHMHKGYADPAKGIVIDWKATTVTEVYDCKEGFFTIMPAGDTRDGWVSTGGAETLASDANFAAPNYGIGGSMARFTLAHGHLYTLDGHLLNTYNVALPFTPDLKSTIDVAFDVETIFPYRNFLFFGTATGMLIYDNSNPAQPQFISRYDHLDACDPVVVEGNTAYVTLRSGTNCNNFINELQIIDVSNVHSPRELARYPMHNPHGLGIDRGTLFICDGAQGLKVFDAKNPQRIELMGHYPAADAYDAIPLGNTLLLIAADGLYQYDYTDPANMRLLSVLHVRK
jgi:hypothetical protein